MKSKQVKDGFAALVAQVSRLWRRRVDERLQPFGLTEATWLPLFYLSQAPGAMRQKQLAATLLLDSSSVVRILDALQAAGLVERRAEAGDRRAKAITLTPLGREMAAKIESVVQKIRGEVLSDLPDPDLQVATHLLQTISRRLSDIADEAGP